MSLELLFLAKEEALIEDGTTFYLSDGNRKVMFILD
jgi:hypothetical protein